MKVKLLAQPSRPDCISISPSFSPLLLCSSHIHFLVIPQALWPQDIYSCFYLQVLLSRQPQCFPSPFTYVSVRRHLLKHFLITLSQMLSDFPPLHCLTLNLYLCLYYSSPLELKPHEGKDCLFYAVLYPQCLHRVRPPSITTK